MRESARVTEGSMHPTYRGPHSRHWEAQWVFVLVGPGSYVQVKASPNPDRDPSSLSVL